MAIFGDEHEVLHVGTFESNPKLEIEKNMAMFERHLFSLSRVVPDVVVVEKVSVSWNVNTIRKIAYYEAVAMIYSHGQGADLQQVQATKARRIVLGKGNLSKEKCYDIVVEKYPRDWAKPNKGGMDETDAFVLAMAGPALSTGA